MSIFQHKKPNISKLIAFGFKKIDAMYSYAMPLMENQFTLYVLIIENDIKTKLIDNATEDEYVLHQMPDVSGKFVGLVRMEYERILGEIAEKCFDADVYYTQKVIEYIRQKYGDELEFLWKNSSNAIWRRKDTKKWYAVLLILSKRKLGFDSDEMVDILNLRIKSEDLESLLDQKKCFPAYHMNKQHWCTICLDSSLQLDDIFHHIDESYIKAIR